MRAEQIKAAVLGALGMLGGVIARFLGGWDEGLIALVVLLAVDFVTGLIVALVFGKSNHTADGACSSRVCFQGLMRKMGILVCVGLGALLDGVFNSAGVCRTAVIVFFMGNEGLSICENLGLMGIPLPKKMREAFEVLRTEKEKKDA